MHRRSSLFCLLLLVTLLSSCAFGPQGAARASVGVSTSVAGVSIASSSQIAASAAGSKAAPTTATSSRPATSSAASAVTPVSPTPAAAPVVQWSVGQPDGEVAPLDPIRGTFSQPMDQASVQQALTLQPPVPGATSWQGATLVFTPTQPWPAGTLVSLAVGDTARTAAGQPLPAPYAWSFVTEPKFQVLELSPAPDTKFVPPNAVIDVTFSHQPDPATLAPNLQITPAVAGAWQVHGRIATYVPTKPLAAGSTIAVSVGTGVHDTTGRPLLESKRWQFTTGQQPPANSSHIYAVGQRIVFAVAVGPHQLAFSAYQVPSIPLTSYRVPTTADFLAAYTARLPNGGTAPVDVSHFQRLQAINAAVAHPQQDGITSVDVPGADSPGIYYVDESGVGKGAGGQFFIISNRGLLVEQSPTGVLVWLTNLVDGAPIAGASLSIVDADTGHPLLTGTTGTDGTFQGALPLQAQPHGPPQPPNLLVLSGSGADMAIGGTADGFFGGGYVTAPNTFRFYAYTDRPIYRPGNVVHMRGIVRREDDVHYHLPGSMTVHLSLTGPVNGTTLLDRQVMPDDTGNFALDVPLSSDLPTGYYSFSIGTGTASTALQDSYYGSFQVEEYRKPAYAVSVSTPDQPWVSGDHIPVTVHARYYFDQPVAGGKVTLRVLSSDWYDPSAPGVAQQDPEQAERGGFQGGAFGTQVSSFDGKLDANGVASFTVPANLGVSTHSQRYAFEATVGDTANDPVTNSTAVIVHRGALVLYGKPASYGGVQGQPLNTTFTVNDLQSHPVAGVPIACDVVQQTYDVTQEGDPKQAYPVYHLVEVPVYHFSTTAGSDGSVVTPVVLPQASPYRLGCSLQDQRGNTVHLDLYLWAASTSGALAPYAAAGDRLTVLTDKQVYAIGDVAHVQVLSPIAGVAALVTVARGKLYSHQILNLKGKSTRFDLPVTADDLPNVDVTVALQGQGRILHGSAQLRIPATARYLQVKVTTDRLQYSPGDRATVTLTATGPDGNPAQGDFSLGMVDEAIYALARQTPPTIKVGFYDVRAAQLRLGASLDAVAGRGGGQGGGGGGGGGGEGQLRTNFPDTGYWSPDVHTSPDGTATLLVTMPDSLTTWRLTAIGATANTDVGYVTSDIVSTKTFHVDPAFPRFLVSGDRVSLAATVTNATDTDVAAKVTASSPALSFAATAAQNVTVPAHGRTVLHWEATAGPPGDATIILDARAGSLSDAVKLTLPVTPGGAAAGVTQAGEITASSASTPLDLPAGAIAGSAALQLAVTPSLAGGILTGSRYLDGYPYDCAEQTVSSFLPAILAKEAFGKAGLSAVQAALPADLESNVATSLQQLSSLQHADGGWNWWSYDQTDPYMTAYVVYGLTEAKRLGYPVVQSSLDRGIAALQRQLDPSTAGLATAAYMLDVLALAGKPVSVQSPLVQGLLARHGDMADYGESYLAQYFATEGDLTDARTLLASLTQEATQTATTASWKEQIDRPPLRGSLVYSTAAALDAFTLLDPANPLALKAAHYLLASRSGDAWDTTHDSALAAMALTRFLLAHGDFAASGHVRISWNGQLLQDVAVTPTTPPLTVQLTAQQMQAHNALQISSDSGTPVFWSAALTYHLATATASSQELTVDRRYLLADGTPATSPLAPGTPVQVVLTVHNTAPFDYVQVRDMLPAGLEVLNPNLATSQTGPQTALQQRNYDQIDRRDQEVDFYFTKLAAGTHTLSYAAQASAAGTFQAPSATAAQMYAPSVRGASPVDTFVVAPSTSLLAP